jgi:hypothetical protein
MVLCWWARVAISGLSRVQCFHDVRYVLRLLGSLSKSPVILHHIRRSDVACWGSNPIGVQIVLYESMDYDLARQLKDAGLPQEGLGFFAAENRVVGSRQHSDTFDAYVPSLSELIGACGDRFSWLVRQADDVGGVRWLACSKGFQPISGATAVEAVARLWLASVKPKPPCP